MEAEHQKGRESSGGSWRRRAEFDKGQRLVRTRQWPMPFQECRGACISSTNQNTQKKQEVKGGGSLCRKYSPYYQ